LTKPKFAVILLKMKNITAKSIKINGQIGQCGDFKVFLGFASSKVLSEISFADVLDEDTGEGYQRPRNKKHSLDFKEYIVRAGTSTIPLTFNLRKSFSKYWEVETSGKNSALLTIHKGVKCLAQVDCQHRLGELNDIDIPLAFMSFIGLDLRSEMAMFYIINSKVKGLTSSLTDYHESNLVNDIMHEAPHLFISRQLNEDPESPWFKMIRYGGETTSGLKRRTSLRMMQKSVNRFLNQTKDSNINSIEEKYKLIRLYWHAISIVFSAEWKDHRHHLLTKGVGLYSLMLLLGDIVGNTDPAELDEEYFVKQLKPLKKKVNWSTHGMFANAGGHKGALQVYGVLKKGIGL